jgi:Holliday junction DNA helicase RuvA
MIAHLRGTISKGRTGEVTVDVGGVGYRVLMPIDAWDLVMEGSERTIWVSTYVREDRFDLFGFLDARSRLLFEELIERQGIGPKLALELCAVPKGLLMQAIAENDPATLTSIKGIGKKTAEKLLIELKSLAEKHVDMFSDPTRLSVPAQFDRDTIAALAALGYVMPDILHALEKLPQDLTTTEQRVTAALQRL